jgi:4,5-DOPA dioxygenase extradiol
MSIQPALFFSHGTMYEAFKNETLKQDFKKIKEQYFKNLPSAIVLFSGHWQTAEVSVTSAQTMQQMDEGFPPEFQSNYSTSGNPILAHKIVELLREKGVKANLDPHRGLDHGALIPLLLLFPDDKIPVIQVSQQYQLDPVFHQKIAEILKPLQDENVLFIGSGGLVHNRHELVKLSGQSLKPDLWAADFDEYISRQLLENEANTNSEKMIDAYNHPNFKQAHPTSEHFLPIVFASVFGEKTTKIYEAFQWKNLSMSAFVFSQNEG